MSDAAKSGWIIGAPAAVGEPPKSEPLIEYPRCAHPRVELRRYCQGNGVEYAARQCLVCGEKTDRIPKSAAPPLAALPAWDMEKAAVWREAAREEWQRRRDAAQQRERAAWQAWYDSYLQSPAWKARRAAVMQRDDFKCQGCMTRRATQVHHLTYVRVGHEMLFDLVAICDQCHNSVHERQAGK